MITLCIVVVRANDLSNKNKLNNKERKIESEKKKKKQYLYIK